MGFKIKQFQRILALLKQFYHSIILFSHALLAGFGLYRPTIFFNAKITHFIWAIFQNRSNN
jgi:hypothetical protein